MYVSPPTRLRLKRRWKCMGKEREGEETFVADAANLGRRRRRRRKGLCSRSGSLPLKRRATKNPKVKFSNC